MKLSLLKRNAPLAVLSAAAAMLSLSGLKTAFAGPPFLTDDPEPVELHHWEIYTFATRDETRLNNTTQAPALEVNNGIFPNTQLHLIVPETFSATSGFGSARGIGDTELGVKYRFLQQTTSRPEVGIFPLAELPTGDADKNLGNGRAYFKLPVWIQKDWGAWTSYGGGGYTLNSAAGERNYPYGGLLVQRTLTPRLTLGGEIFLQDASAEGPERVAINLPLTLTESVGTRSTRIWNAGGQYSFTPDFSLLFTAGHSFAGEGNSVLYIGLYRTFGPGAP